MARRPAIGIMNILMVSVTERTEEISIRMALCSDQGGRQYCCQFLFAAVTRATLAGILGIDRRGRNSLA